MNSKEEAGRGLGGYTPRSEQRKILPSAIVAQTHRPEPIIVDTPQGRRCVGKIVGNTLQKKAKGSCHLMRDLDAWGFQLEVVEQAYKEGVQTVEVEDIETGIVYSVSLEVLLEKGIQKDFGHGLQLFLPRRYWKKNLVGQGQFRLVVGGE